VIGRKNYYGAHATWAAHLAAAVWTITTTAQRNHHQPLTYLTEYLTACSNGTPPQGPALDQFLPWQATPDNNPANGIRPDP
jgi:transposase